MQIPIIRHGGMIVGWTERVPEVRGTLLHHPEAERLIGGAVFCAYVQIDDATDAHRAGAPPDWKGPWRCMALCGEGAVIGNPGDLPIEPRHPAPH